jgi:hypothetical protein
VAAGAAGGDQDVQANLTLDEPLHMAYAKES